MKYKDLHVRLTEDDHRALRILAQREDRNLVSMIRVLIRREATAQGVHVGLHVVSGADAGPQRG